MKKMKVLMAGMALVFVTAAPVRAEERTSLSNTAIGLELLGSGILYSLQASFRPIEPLAFNLGFSFIPLTDTVNTSKINLIQFPVSVSGLAFGPSHYLEVFGGGDIVLVSGTINNGSSAGIDLTGSGFIPQFGAGYRYWPVDGGFHFRANVTGFLLSGGYGLRVLPGLAFGVAF